MPALMAAAENPEGTFTSTATEAGPEDDKDEAWRSLTPAMTLAVRPLVTAMTGKTWPLAWTSLQLAGSIIMRCVCKKSIPKMAMDTSANKNFSTGWLSRWV